MHPQLSLRARICSLISCIDTSVIPVPLRLQADNKTCVPFLLPTHNFLPSNFPLSSDSEHHGRSITNPSI